MNREIKFRGKHKHLLPQNKKLDGIWVYGYLCSKDYISSDEFVGDMLVDSETVGQYTGLHDKNGVEIYEGDIIEYTYVGEDEETAKHYPKEGVINFKNNGWHINSKWLDGYTMRMFKFEVMGNIYEVEDEKSNFK